jgi:membrane protease YdiL (CAAX protease family)
MRNLVRSALRQLVWNRHDGRVRTGWRVLFPLLAGFIALQLTSALVLSLDVGRGAMMLGTFLGTTLVMLIVVACTARYLDRQPVTAYGYHVSRRWWLDLVGGVGVGTLVVGLAFLIAHRMGSLRILGTATLSDSSTTAGLLLFLVAFVGVSFYEEFIYRGSFMGNTSEWLAAKDVSPPARATLALVASSFAFAVIHLPGAVLADANLILVGAKTGLLGGLFGLGYLATDELALPMGLHLGVNYALMNVFGIGAEGFTSIPSLLVVESTATGLWSPVRGLPLFAATLVGYAIVAGWLQCRSHEHTAQPNENQSRYSAD